MRRREFSKEDNLVFSPLWDVVGDRALVAYRRATLGPSTAGGPSRQLEAAL